MEKASSTNAFSGDSRHDSCEVIDREKRVIKREKIEDQLWKMEEKFRGMAERSLDPRIDTNTQLIRSVQMELIPISFSSKIECDLLASLLLGIIERRIKILDMKFTSDKSLLITYDVIRMPDVLNEGSKKNTQAVCKCNITST